MFIPKERISFPGKDTRKLKSYFHGTCRNQNDSRGSMRSEGTTATIRFCKTIPRCHQQNYSVEL